MSTVFRGKVPQKTYLGPCRGGSLRGVPFSRARESNQRARIGARPLCTPLRESPVSGLGRYPSGARGFRRWCSQLCCRRCPGTKGWCARQTAPPCRTVWAGAVRLSPRFAVVTLRLGARPGRFPFASDKTQSRCAGLGLLPSLRSKLPCAPIAALRMRASRPAPDGG